MKRDRKRSRIVFPRNAAKHNLLPTQVSAWKKQAVEGMADVFAKGGSSDERETEIKELHAKIGRLAVENDFLAKGLKL